MPGISHSLKALYEEEARNGLQNIRYLAGLAQGYASIQQVEDLLNIIDAQRAWVSTLQKMSKSITSSRSSQPQDSIPGTE